jgi:hypothetical protein
MPERFDRTLPIGLIVAHRLNGEYDLRKPSSRPGHLRSARILRSKRLADEQSNRLRATLTSIDSFGGEGARCFLPGFGFTVGGGPDVVEVLVCLQCYWVYFFCGDTKIVEALSEAGYRQLAEFYVELFPDSDPNFA